METELLVLIAVVNSGFSEKVKEIANDGGARGGTIIPVNGSVPEGARRLYGLKIQPEKEMVMILVKTDIVDKILENLYTKLGSGSDANGVFFTLPVSHASENLLKQFDPKKDNED